MRRLRAAALGFTMLLGLTVAIAPLAHAQIPGRAQGFTPNFQDADLAYVFTALAQAAGLNIIHSNLPVRSVTLRSQQPVSQADIIGLIYSLAAANGVTVSEGNGFLRLQGGGADTGAPPDLRQLFIYRLRHARAPQLAQTLSALFGGALPNARGNAQTLSQQITALQNPQIPRPQQVFVNGIGGALQQALVIIPDESTNSLLIRATPADYQILQQAIQGLDIRPLQVLIEVVIAEVRRNKNLHVGTSVTGNNTNTSNAGSNNGEITVTSPPATNTDDFSLKIVKTGDVNVTATLSALAASGNVRILSRPLIQAQNNQEANIAVGEQRPFIAASQTLPNDNGIRNEVVQYKEVTTSLTITPTINPDGYVNLLLTQEVNSASNEVQFGAPIITTRSAATQLLAKDGQTVVIGGLIGNTEDRSRSGVPYLRDIPVLGFLFGSTRVDRIQSELFLFLTPHIVMSDADVDRVREEVELNSRLLQEVIRTIRPLVRPIIKPDSIRGGK